MIRCGQAIYLHFGTWATATSTLYSKSGELVENAPVFTSLDLLFWGGQLSPCSELTLPLLPAIVSLVASGHWFSGIQGICIQDGWTIDMIMVWGRKSSLWHGSVPFQSKGLNTRAVSRELHDHGGNYSICGCDFVKMVHGPSKAWVYTRSLKHGYLRPYLFRRSFLETIVNWVEQSWIIL